MGLELGSQTATLKPPVVGEVPTCGNGAPTFLCSESHRGLKSAGTSPDRGRQERRGRLGIYSNLSRDIACARDVMR
jgi:hypothetical protein